MTDRAGRARASGCWSRSRSTPASLLVEAGEWEAATTAHAAHFLALAEVTGPRYRDGGQVAALARIDPEHANLSAAAERMLAAGDVEGPARMAWALWLYWWLRGHHGHGRRLAETVLERGGLADDVHARAALAAATMAFAMDDVEAARRWWERAASYAGGDPVIACNAVAGVGLAALAAGDLTTARARFEAAADIAATGGPEAEWTWALAHVWLGTVALLCEDPDGAVRLVEAGLGSARRRGDRLSSYIALYNLVQVELARGEHARARRHLEEGLRLSLETGDQANLAYLLDALAVTEAADGAVSRVPLLLGAAQAIREAIGSRGYGYYRPDPSSVAAAAEDARRRLGPDRYDDALDAGRALAPDAAAHLALGEHRPPDHRPPRAAAPRGTPSHPHTTRTPRAVRGAAPPVPPTVVPAADRSRKPPSRRRRDHHPRARRRAGHHHCTDRPPAGPSPAWSPDSPASPPSPPAWAPGPSTSPASPVTPRPSPNGWRR